MQKYLSLALLLLTFNTLSAQQYTKKASMPNKLYALHATILNDKIYVISGSDLSVVQKVIQIYNPATDTWTMGKPLPVATTEGFCCTINGKIYMVGGFDVSGAIGAVQEYNPLTDTWALKKPMPTARCMISGAVVDNKIYITCGWIGSYKTLEVYDPATDTWTTKSDIPLGFLQNNGGAAIGTDIYITGGRSYSGGTYYAHHFKYNTATNQWATMKPMPTASFSGSSVVYKGKIHYFGGAAGGSSMQPYWSVGVFQPTVNSHYLYDHISDTWSAGMSMPQKVAGHATVAVHNKIYIIGGMDSAGKLKDDVWEYSDTTTTLVPGNCHTPVDTVKKITMDSAFISWNAIIGAAGYQYKISEDSIIPINSAFTNKTNFGAGQLIPGKKYYIHLRTICSPGDSSGWIRSEFTASICDTPVDTIKSILYNSALVSWNTINGALGYEYKVNEDSIAPVSPVFTNATNHFAAPLKSNTKYYVHLRTICSPGDSSAWVRSEFTTNICEVPADTIKNITHNSALITWNDLGDVSGYEYKVSEDSAVPPSSPTFTNATNYYAIPLTPNTKYYLHLRTVCGPGDSSEWHRSQFTTLPVSVNDVNKNDIMIMVYPNPVHDVITVKLLQPLSAHSVLSIRDLKGAVIKTIKLTEERTDIDMSGLAKGIYFLKYSDEKQNQVLKFTKM